MIKQQKTICFIFARGGSKGLPGKNIIPLAGVPLIAYAISCAKNIKEVSDIIVSTDDQEIADVAMAYGAKVPFLRPEELASDKAPEWLAWQHAMHWYHETHGAFDVFLSLPTTAPLRDVSDVIGCLDALARTPEADAAITVRPAERSPYFNMVVKDQAGFATLFAQSDTTFSRRQDTPPIFDIVTVAYAVRPEFLQSSHTLFSGKIIPVEVPVERAIDIDTEYDFTIAEFLMTKRLQERGPGNLT